MRQYYQVKAKHPETILLFRIGDFYETFDEDAKLTAKVLGITLTKRNNGAAGEIPLAGFPYHALDTYLPRLLKGGLRVAVCEQLEDPKLAKGIVKRDVIEVVSPGIALIDAVLDKKQNNYLAAVVLATPIASSSAPAGVSFADISTGEFFCSEMPLKTVVDLFGTLHPSEILLQRRDHNTLAPVMLASIKTLVTKSEDWVSQYDYCYELLINQFSTQSLKGFGIEDLPLGITAAGTVLHHVRESQKGNLAHVRRIRYYDASTTMILDPATKRNLEIMTTSTGDNAGGTLSSIMDKTSTAMGGRLFKRWLIQPLRSLELIRERLDSVGQLKDSRSERADMIKILSDIGDLERLIARIATQRANPREVRQLRHSLSKVPLLREITSRWDSSLLARMHSLLDPHDALVTTIDIALEDDPPLSLSDGGIIRRGYHKELDELRAIAGTGKQWIADLQIKERGRTGIPSLKIGYNNVFGYYIEITNTHKEKAPPDYIRKQTLTNAERYITPELKEFEDKILHAEERILSLESELYAQLREQIASHAERIQQTAFALATFDVLVSLAELAHVQKYCKPEVTEGELISIKNGRHPVLETLLPPGERYTPNDTLIDTEASQIHIITGPNMSGKSSYLRQIGLITLLTHIGSFVPAESAIIGLVDRIYTRVGASDNITAGESTFLVEMHEAANIVNTATKKSLILLDEIGRGTSTFDGISIAWALTEYLHEHVGARTLFATHYHELNRLADLYPRIKNYKVDVKEYLDKVIFLHKVLPGFADHSYGIQVAQMAGIPAEITERAKEILQNLEETELRIENPDGDNASRRKTLKSSLANVRSSEKKQYQLSLFEYRTSEIEARLKALSLEEITPLEALNLLVEMKRQAEGT